MSFAATQFIGFGSAHVPSIGGNDAYTKLLLHFDGSDESTTFIDSSSSAHTVTENGNSQIDTAQSVFGGASGLFDGSGDYLTIPSSEEWRIGTGDFTIDMRIRPSSVAATKCLLHLGSVSDGIILRFTSSYVGVYLNGGQETFSWSPSVDTWYHLLISRNGTDFRCFVNGSQIGSTVSNSSDLNASASDGIWIGAQNNSSDFFNGHIDELRLSVGIARETSNFTPPTAPYS